MAATICFSHLGDALIGNQVNGSYYGEIKNNFIRYEGDQKTANDWSPLRRQRLGAYVDKNSFDSFINSVHYIIRLSDFPKQ